MADVTVPADAVSSGRIALTPGQVSSVTFAANVQTIQVWRDNTPAAPVYVTTDGSTPVADGKNCYEVLPGLIGEYRTPDVSEGDVVKLLSAEAVTVRVERS